MGGEHDNGSGVEGVERRHSEGTYPMFLSRRNTRKYSTYAEEVRDRHRSGVKK
jgi:hypothetical protein